MKTNKTLIFLALAIAALTVPRNAALSTQPKPTRPNILFAIADDWGYGHTRAAGRSWGIIFIEQNFDGFPEII